MNKPIREIKDRLNTALNIRNMTPKELSDKTGIPKSSISQYMSGYAKPKQDRIYLMSKVLNVNPTWLLGYDVDINDNEENTTMEYVHKIDKIRLPFLGSIACGKPIFVDEERESYVMLGTSINADFCLKAKGDSMINARINDGDIIFIKKQEVVNNGEIAVVIIEDEATLKRFYYYKEKNMVILKPENSKYDDIVLVGEELNNVRILGKAVAFQSDII